jgi:hypothetical protein
MEESKIKVEWKGKSYEIFNSFVAQRLSEETFEEYKVRQTIFNKIIKHRSKKGIPTEFGRLTKAGYNKRIKQSIAEASKLPEDFND